MVSGIAYHLLSRQIISGKHAPFNDIILTEGSSPRHTRGEDHTSSEMQYVHTRTVYKKRKSDPRPQWSSWDAADDFMVKPTKLH